MERIRKKYICNNQIKKGIGGTKELVKLINDGFSTALMIDQRVSEGIDSNFFNEKASTTTIPAQLVKKYDFTYKNLKIKKNTKMKIKKFDITLKIKLRSLFSKYVVAAFVVAISMFS